VWITQKKIRTPDEEIIILLGRLHCWKNQPALRRSFKVDGLAPPFSNGQYQSINLSSSFLIRDFTSP